MKIDRYIHNSSNYLYNYYSQSKKYADNVHKSIGTKDANIASYYQQQNNTQTAGQKVNKPDSYPLPESSNTSKASNQLTQKKSDSVSADLSKSYKNTPGSLDPFLAMEKLYKISSNVKKT